MGTQYSTEEKKSVDSNGSVNNNFVVENTVDVQSKIITILLLIICVIKILEFLVYLCSRYTQQIKKKYQVNAV